MKKINLVIFFCVLIIYNTNSQSIKKGRNQAFDLNWKFKKGKDLDAKLSDFNDADWRSVNVPHDWSIEDITNSPTDSTTGPFYKNAVGKQSTAFTVGGTAWYRKSFIVDKTSKGMKVFIQFDGIYRNADVWINGHHLGNHPNGYTSFVYDLTNHLNTIGNKNVIAVQVKNEGHSSRWYTGSGIYRHVWLHVVHPTHVANWGVKVVATDITERNAIVHLNSTIDNPKTGTLFTEIYSSTGKIVAKDKLEITHKPRIIQKISIPNPDIWSTETPYLYKAKLILKQNGKTIDEYTQTFGVRSIKFDAETGFSLNGNSMKLKGGCIHHDNGALGAAAIDRAEERKIELLKKNGYNSIRLSHNPSSPYLLDVCDRLGILVIDEFFDMWNQPKTPDDYSKNFLEWGEKDIATTINRDFNHPSVIMWSIGNEIPEIIDTLGYKTSAKLADLVRSIDSTRAVTNAIPIFIPLISQQKWETTDPSFASLDVGGYNYAYGYYENDHKRVPNRIMVATEYFASKALENWDAVEKNPYVIGMFSWAAIDYLGEAGLGLARLKSKKEKFDFVRDFTSPQWPIFNSYTGELDLIGNKKASSHYLDVVWKRSPLEIVVHRPIPKNMKEDPGYWGFPDEMKSWTWPGHENDTLQVRVFTRSQKVRLELNGKIIEEKTVPNNSITTSFNVLYQKGKLVARCFDNGTESSSQVLSTAEKPFSIRLKSDRNIIKANKNDLAYICVEIVDRNGNVASNLDDTLIKFQIAGRGSIAGVANANPRDMSSFQKPEKKVYQGKNQIIIRPNNKAGKITVVAQAENLLDGKIIIESK